MIDVSEDLNVVSFQSPEPSSSLERLKERFETVPQEYLDMCAEASEIVLRTDSNKPIRFWSSSECIGMDELYQVSEEIPGSMPIGDTGGRGIVYMVGEEGFGVYIVGWGALSREDARFIAPSLTKFVGEGVGLDVYEKYA